MFRKKSFYNCILIAIMLMTIVLFTACESNGDTSEGGVSKTNAPLKIASTSDIPNHLPLTDMSLPGFFVSFNVFDGLTTPKDGKWADVIPALAENWEISDDGLEYVFHIRQGVKFHDGSDFGAGDVVATFDYMRDYQSSLFTSVDSYEAVDENTVKVIMKTPYVDFLARLGSLFWGMLSSDALEEHGFTNGAAIGCGPYYIDEYRTGEILSLKAFPDYWDKENMPKIQDIDFQVIPDPNTAFLALQNGDVDLLFFATDVQYQTALKNNSIDEYVFVDPSNINMLMNTEKSNFDDIKVREALHFIIDREQVNMAACDGLAKAASSIWAETSPIYVDDKYEYNVEKGLTLLKEAGYQPSDIKFDIACPGDATYKSAAENVQAQLLTLGFNVTVTTSDYATINEKRAVGDFDALIIDTGANTYAPFRSITAMFMSTGVENYSGLSTTDPQFQNDMDKSIAAGLGSPTVEESNEAGRVITEVYQKNYNILPLIQKNSYHLYNNKVQGLYYEDSSGFGKFHKAYWVE